MSLEKARQILESSWFSDDGDSEGLAFSTREHGDMSKDEAGADDIEEARRLVKKIREECPDLQARIETCDEWTMISVSEAKP